jgi:pyruvate formate lyase activating enzyme
MENGLVFNIQRYSIHDGPGIRTTVFLKGCPLRCSWCHNPEGISPEPEVVVIENRCMHCGQCRDGKGDRSNLPERPEGGHRRAVLVAAQIGPVPFSVAVCPTGARQLIGRRMSVEEVMDEVLKDRVFYEQSAGGVTFSGGEPLMQPRFLKNLLEACRAEGIHTAVDTSGYAAREDLLSIAPLADLFLYDLKIMDDQLHRQWTGASNVPIMENLLALGEVHKDIWIRMPLVPGFNDNPKHVEAVARFARSVPGVCQVNLLPYHATATHKLKGLGRSDQPAARVTPTPKMIELARDTFQALGMNIQIGG